MIKTKKKNKVKPDTILKSFWRDNERFADLFNAILFDGENVIDPEELKEADTDISAVLKFNGHADTLQKILDVVKKSAYGVDFVILGLENQQHIHYGMPLRIMLGDTLGYIKEYQEIAKKNKTEGNWKGTEDRAKGGRMNMCRALEELKQEGIAEGIEQGIEKGMEKGLERGKILARFEDGMSPEEIAHKMGLTVKQVEQVLEEHKADADI